MKKLLALLLLTVPVFADIAVTPGSGKTVKSDTVGGAEYQNVKIIDATAGSTTGGVVDASGNFKVNISSFLVTPNVTATNTSFGATQAVDASLNSSVSIKGSSNTVVLGAGAATVGSIGNTGFNVNNTVTVQGTGAFNTTGSTHTIVNPAGQTLAVSGVVNMISTTTLTVAAHLVTGSTVTIVTPAGQTLSVSGVVNAISTSPIVAQPSGSYTVTPGTGTWPVTGTFSTSGSSNTVFTSAGQTLSVSGVMNIISTNTLPVSGSFNVTGSSMTVYASAGQTLPISGVVNIISTNTLPVSGSFSATGSSVTVFASAGQTLPISGVVNIISTNTLQISGSLAAQGSTVTVVNPAGQTMAVSGVVNAISTSPIAAQPSGTYTVTPGTGVWNASQSGSYTVTPGTGTWGISGNVNAISTKTYSYSGFGASFSASTGTILSAATANYIAAVCGNATTTVLVYGVRVSCTQTTAGIASLSVVKTTSVFSGSYGTMTVTADDGNFTVQYSSAIWFQVNATNPTLNFSSYYIDSAKIGCMAAATASPDDIYMSPSTWRIKPKVLRGVSQCIAVTLNNTTVTGGNFSVGFDWIETTAIP